MRQPIGSGFGLGLISKISRLGHIPRDTEAAAPAGDDEEYFGRRYFGGRFYGARYFG